MSGDNNQMSDGVKIEHNSDDNITAMYYGTDLLAEHEGEIDTQLSLPDRPADSAKAASWKDYTVALGAHPETVEDMKVADLRDLADHLGG